MQYNIVEVGAIHKIPPTDHKTTMAVANTETAKPTLNAETLETLWSSK